MYVGAGGGMCHVLVTVFPPLYRSLSKRVPVGRVRQHHSAHTLVLKKTSHLHTQAKKKKKMLKSDGLFECDWLHFTNNIILSEPQNEEVNYSVFSTKSDL